MYSVAWNTCFGNRFQQCKRPGTVSLVFFKNSMEMKAQMEIRPSRETYLKQMDQFCKSSTEHSISTFRSNKQWTQKWLTLLVSYVVKIPDYDIWPSYFLWNARREYWAFKVYKTLKTPLLLNGKGIEVISDHGSIWYCKLCRNIEHDPRNNIFLYHKFCVPYFLHFMFELNYQAHYPMPAFGLDFSAHKPSVLSRKRPYPWQRVAQLWKLGLTWVKNYVVVNNSAPLQEPSRIELSKAWVLECSLDRSSTHCTHVPYIPDPHKCWNQECGRCLVKSRVEWEQYCIFYSGAFSHSTVHLEQILFLDCSFSHLVHVSYISEAHQTWDWDRVRCPVKTRVELK